MLNKKYRIKSGFIFLSYIGMLLFLGYRLFSVQFLQYSYLHPKAKDRHEIEIKLEPKRGSICDRNGNLLAVSVQMPSVCADPKEVKEPLEVAYQLAPILGLSKDFLYERLTRKKRFVWLKRKIMPELKKQIEALKFKGIFFRDESTRFYPKGSIASHVLGFVNTDNKGLEGIEFICDKYLRGKSGVRITEKDARNREVLGWRNKEVPPVEGYKVVLTIDEVIQYIVEEELDKAIEKYNPDSAIIIVLDPYTGEILALANRPTYDPNEYNKASKSNMRNRAVTDSFEPGSVFKMFSAAAALNENIVELNDNIFCENGAYKVPGGILHDHRSHGTLSFQQVIEKSSNIGMAKIGQRLGKERLYGYLKDFGFGENTEILLPGEVTGKLRPTYRWSRMSITRIPMGHEVSVTAIQLVRALGAVANGGKLLEPLIIKKVVDSQGRIVKEFKPQVVDEVVYQDASDSLKIALTGVVTPHGTALRAALPGFTVAGKTGTAQKLNPDGTYSHSDFVASFIGFVPADVARIAMLVVFDNPKPLYYGGVVAAPVFKNIAGEVLSYLNVEPEIDVVQLTMEN